MSNNTDRSNVIDFNEVRHWTLLSWMEAVSAKCKSNSNEMDLEDWLAALDADSELTPARKPSVVRGGNVIDLAQYRSQRSGSLLKKMIGE